VPRTHGIAAAAIAGGVVVGLFLAAFVSGAAGVRSAADVTLQLAPRGLGSVSADPPGRQDGQLVAECARNVAQHACEWQYTRGTTVRLTAKPDAATGRSLSAWSTPDCPGTAACTIVLDEDTSVVAVFTPLRLAVRLSNGAAGTVTTDPAGSPCRGELHDPAPDLCREFPARTRVMLTVHANAPHVFRTWSPGCSATAPDSCSLSVIDEATWVAVAFDGDDLPVLPTTIRVQFRLGKEGSGGGRVTAKDIDCGSQCRARYDYGTQLTLSAAAAHGSFFDGWRQDVCLRSATRCTVPAGPITEVVARFERPPGAPARLHVTQRARRSITVSWRHPRRGAAAKSYRVYLNGVARGRTAKTAYTLRGLKCGRRYRVAVAALDAHGHRSPKARTPARTKRCARG
jgi:Fibronectin type III domain/Divergent InlB B-repeat domain